MIQYLKKIMPLAFTAIIFFTSCSNGNTNTEEQLQINQMDSTEEAIEESREKLEEQTEKVEESLEKLEKEFDSTN